MKKSYNYVGPFTFYHPYVIIFMCFKFIYIENLKIQCYNFHFKQVNRKIIYYIYLCIYYFCCSSLIPVKFHVSLRCGFLSFCGTFFNISFREVCCWWAFLDSIHLRVSLFCLYAMKILLLDIILTGILGWQFFSAF